MRDTGGEDYVTTVQFGAITLPLNPRSMSRSYQRALSKHGLLGGAEKLESRKTHLSVLRFNGHLTGSTAKTVMDDLETAFEASDLSLFLAPSIPAPGELAIITRLEFGLEESVEAYIQYIRYSVELLFTDEVKTPSWAVYAEDEQTPTPDFDPVADIISISFEDNMAGLADGFTIACDNSTGQNKYPRFDCAREVKIEIGYDAVNERRLWGIIDAVDYRISKSSGSIVTISGRDYISRLMEASVFDRTYDWKASSDIIKDIVNGGLTGVALGWADWEQWGADTEIGIEEITPDVTEIYVAFRNEKRLSAIAKVSDIRVKEYFVDSSEAVVEDEGRTKPQLVWRTRGEDVSVITKTWGTDIIDLSIRRNLIPQRNRIEVYGSEFYTIADTDESTLIPSGLPNTEYDLSNQIRYDTRKEIIEDSSLDSQSATDAVALATLAIKAPPDMDIKLAVVGDKSVAPGGKLTFTDGSLTGHAGTYRLVSLTHRLSLSRGYVTDCGLRNLAQDKTAATLASLLRRTATDALGSPLVNVNPQFPVVGTVTEITG